MQDKAHPRVSNDDIRATGQQPTPPFADVSNSILQPWAAEALRKLSAETLSGRPFIPQLATCRLRAKSDGTVISQRCAQAGP
jgi:hypothetical protein